MDVIAGHVMPSQAKPSKRSYCAPLAAGVVGKKNHVCRRSSRWQKQATRYPNRHHLSPSMLPTQTTRGSKEMRTNLSCCFQRWMMTATIQSNGRSFLLYVPGMNDDKTNHSIRRIQGWVSVRHLRWWRGNALHDNTTFSTLSIDLETAVYPFRTIWFTGHFRTATMKESSFRVICHDFGWRHHCRSKKCRVSNSNDLM